MADGNDTCTCLRHFEPERAQAAGWTFRFYLSKFVSFLELSAMVTRKQIATCFSVKKKKLGSQSAAIESRVWRNIGMHIVPNTSFCRLNKVK